MWKIPNVRGRLVAGLLCGIVGVGVVAAALRALTGGTSETAAAPAAPPRMLITATDYAFDAPAAAEAGPVDVTLVNNGQENHHAIAVRLNDGVSAEQFIAALSNGPEAALKLATIHGGPATADPGANSRVSLDLAAGQYLFLCLVQDGEGVPHVAKGMMHAMTVAPSTAAEPVQAPRADVRVTLKDFAFDIAPNVPAGRQTWEVVNAGPRPHELVLYTLLPGKTFDDLVAYAKNPTGPRPVSRVGAVELLTTDRRGWLDFDLRPGGYALVCTIPDPATGIEHVDLGMLTTFVVVGG